MVEHLTRLLKEHVVLMQAAAQVLAESRSRVAAVAHRLGSLIAGDAAPAYVEMKQY